MSKYTNDSDTKETIMIKRVCIADKLSKAKKILLIAGALLQAVWNLPNSKTGANSANTKDFTSS